jgi:hypothetical protein
MNAQDWVAYFEQNQHDRRGIAWHEPVDVPATVHEPLRLTLAWLRQVERRDAGRLRRWTDGPAAALLAAEKEELARLLDRSLDRLGGAVPPGWPGIEVLTGPWSVVAVIVRDAVMLRLYGTLCAAVPDPVLRVVCDQILHDKKFHLRFLCALRGAVPRGVLTGLGWWAVASAVRRHQTVLRAVDVPVRDFIRGCRENLLAVEAALFAGGTFARGAADQMPPVTWPLHKARG